MKKKIAILGSTGSIGKSLISVIVKNKLQHNIKLISANKNYKLLLKQAQTLNVKNLIITNSKAFDLAKKFKKSKNIKIFNNYDCFNKIFKKKIDYSMCAITGLAGLVPTLKIIKHSKKIAIANKEAIICGWNLINKELKNNKTVFIPVDSEHYSIWYDLKNNHDKINKVFLTASGGPFNNLPKKKFKYIKVEDALNHPNWKMGKKISVDSATMINKVFEVIEAKNIFNLNYNQIEILVHPKSYIHAIIRYNNGMTKMVAHKTIMEIPIYGSLETNNTGEINSKNNYLEILNNLKLKYVDKKKFPMINILKNLRNYQTLYETVIVSANDELVELFLNKKIHFVDIYKNLSKFINLKEFKNYNKIKIKNINEILKLDKYVRSQIQKKFN